MIWNILIDDHLFAAVALEQLTMKFVGYAFGILIALGIQGVPRAHAELMWGVNGHPLATYPGTTYEQQLNYLVDLGATSYRVNIGDAKSGDALESLIAAAIIRG